MMVTAKATPRGRGLMMALTETPLLLVKREVEEMTAEEARDIWGHLEPFFSIVCARASPRKRDRSWVLLSQKMDLIRSKANEADG